MSLVKANPALFGLKALFKACARRDPTLETARFNLFVALQSNDNKRAKQWLEALITGVSVAELNGAFCGEPEMLARIRKHLDDLADVINDRGKE